MSQAMAKHTRRCLWL